MLLPRLTKSKTDIIMPTLDKPLRLKVEPSEHISITLIRDSLASLDCINPALNENEEPILLKCRILTEEPIAAKSRTERFVPIFSTYLRLTDEPRL
jgi:hypothetical protein